MRGDGFAPQTPQGLADPGALLATTHRTDGGLLVRPRLTRPSDMPRIRGFLEALSPEARRRRFFSSMPVVPQATLHHFAFFDPRKRLVVAATAMDSGREEIVGLADVAHLDTGLAELGVVVGDEHGRRGRGQAAHRGDRLAGRAARGHPAAGRAAGGQPGDAGADAPAGPHHQLTEGERRGACTPACPPCAAAAPPDPPGAFGNNGLSHGGLYRHRRPWSPTAPPAGACSGPWPRSRPREVQSVVDDVAEVQPFWAALPLAERARYMRRAAQVVIDSLDELSELLTREQGKPRNESYVMELLPTIDALHWIAHQGPKILADERVSLPIFLKQKRAKFAYEPLGVVGVIAPWNYPWSIPFGEVAIALMAGNGVVLKPASLTPLIGQRIQ